MSSLRPRKSRGVLGGGEGWEEQELRRMAMRAPNCCAPRYG